MEFPQTYSLPSITVRPALTDHKIFRIPDRIIVIYTDFETVGHGDFII